MMCSYDLEGKNQAAFLKITIKKYYWRLVRSVMPQISTLKLTSSLRTVWFSEYTVALS
jgi:hypothetical protein